jgi:hypothetical protein
MEKTIAELALMETFFRCRFPDDPDFDSGQTTAVRSSTTFVAAAPERKHLDLLSHHGTHVTWQWWSIRNGW